MKEEDNSAFSTLFKEAYHKCFGFALATPMSETESKHFGNIIFEETGLVIGAKSLKNYSAYIVNVAESKPENPSVATLDTLARYVLNAPYTDEVKRKDKEAHFPYWFQYKNQLAKVSSPVKAIPESKNIRLLLLLIVLIIVTILFFISRLFHSKQDETFTDLFHHLQEDSLKNNGWLIQSKDTAWWNRRAEKPSCLTLFTLRGDNWPDSSHTPLIRNLLLRKISSDCFETEIHLENFTPAANWQQAGILLMEDTLLTSKTVRLSIAYNDFFGGFNKPKEIIIQGVSSGGNGVTVPEEIAHIPLFSIEPGQEDLIENNMKHAALRIEKNNDHFRFLYSASPLENFALKEAFVKDLDIKPKYIALFALEGFVNDTNYLPVHFTFYKQSGIDCKN